MLKDIQIAWRNLWRNKRRTLITISAVVLAVLLSTLMSSMQEGTYARMIENIVKFYSGYIQIHHPDFWESKSINDTYIADESFISSLNSNSDIAIYVPRLESFTLISSGVNTKGCSLIGIDPKQEDRFSGLSRWVKEGRYLTDKDDGILLAVNIAKNIGVRVGDTLIMLSQGFQGSSASALMPLKGILEFPSPQLNNFAAYIEINNARKFFDAGNRVTSYALLVRDYSRVNDVAKNLTENLGSNYSVKTWEQMQPELVNMIDSDRAGAIIMKGILYLLVGFGILGTIIMLMAERRKEMGVMIAIGMQKYRLKRILFYESFFMGMIGVFIGILISIPIILALINNPVHLSGDMAKAYESFGIEAVISFIINPGILINQAVTVFILTLIIAIYPVLIVKGLSVIKALRGQ